MKNLKNEAQVDQLCTLSDLPPTVDAKHVISLIQAAPDPETATRSVLEHVSSHSEALRRKWRQTIWHMWSRKHPRLPRLPDLALATEDVATVPFFQDAMAYLQELAHEPGQLHKDKGEYLLVSEDIARLQTVLPSSRGKELWLVENEWSYIHLRRLRATLQALRLVRPVKNKLTLVRSRYDQFLKLPPTQQFYLLWHTDVYHTSWAAFSAMWGDYIQLIQDNVTLLWDIHDTVHAQEEEHFQHWCENIIEVFTSLWHETGLLEVGSGRWAWMKLLRQYSIAPALQRIILHDVFEQHGLIEQHDSLLTEKFAWTHRGAVLLKAERTQKLPCSLKML